MDKEKYELKIKEGLDFYARLIRDNPKDKERYDPCFQAYQKAWLELTTSQDKEMKTNRKSR